MCEGMDVGVAGAATRTAEVEAVSSPRDVVPTLRQAISTDRIATTMNRPSCVRLICSIAYQIRTVSVHETV